MNSEKIVMGEAPEKESKSKKGILFLIFAALIVIVILVLIIKPFSSKEPESKIVEKQVKQEIPLDEEKPSASSSEEPAVTQTIVSDTTKPKVVVGKPVVTPPPIVSTPKPLTHVVQKGDCLWNIAYNEFGDPFKWTKIYEENKDKINNPNLIYPNQEFKIPKNDK